MAKQSGPHPMIQAVLRQAAKHGQGGDTELAHMTHGDTVVSAERQKRSPIIQKMLREMMGKDYDKFTVGPKGKRNDTTGLLAFDDSTGDTTGDVLGHELGHTNDPGPSTGAAPSTGDLLSAPQSGGTNTFSNAGPSIASSGPATRAASSLNSTINDTIQGLTPGDVLGALIGGVVPGVSALSGVSGLAGGPTTSGLIDAGIASLGGVTGPAPPSRDQGNEGSVPFGSTDFNVQPIGGGGGGPGPGSTNAFPSTAGANSAGTGAGSAAGVASPGGGIQTAQNAPPSQNGPTLQNTVSDFEFLNDILRV